MGEDLNMGFHHNKNPVPDFDRHRISFQSGASAMDLSGNTNRISNPPGSTQASSPHGSYLFNSTALNYDYSMRTDWSVEEQYRLEECLIKYANEPNVMKYVKIAAMLQDKSVRDVALRCRWMMRKRKKPEECNAGKRLKDRKDKLVGSSSTSNINTPSISALNIADYSFMMQHMDRNDHLRYEASGVATDLLEQNAHIFDQIVANFSLYKLHDNIDLFCQTRDNISSVIYDMRNMPGIMSHMPTLPMCMNEDLANSVLPNVIQNQTEMFESPCEIRVKQEPRC